MQNSALQKQLQQAKLSLNEMERKYEQANIEVIRLTDLCATSQKQHEDEMQKVKELADLKYSAMINTWTKNMENKNEEYEVRRMRVSYWAESIL